MRGLGRIGGTAAFLVLLAPCTVSAAAKDTLPPVLAPYAVRGHLSLDKMGWLRGDLPDATSAERMRWKKVEAWDNACIARHTAAGVAQLRKMGVANPKIKRAGLDGTDCGFVDRASNAVSGFKSWSQFKAALAEARRAFAPFLYATEIAETESEPPASAPLSQKLRAAIVGDQILSWGAGWMRQGDVQPPKLPDDAKRLIWFVSSQATEKRDLANRAMLKAVVANSDWPSISAVGKRASSDAWLLAQHADDDPAFQLKVLRLMKPLVKRGEVSRQNYAYLYDRVMLKVAGRQRYGTQTTCRNGHVLAECLEDPAHVDARRKSVGLETWEKYRAQMKKLDGANCGR